MNWPRIPAARSRFVGSVVGLVVVKRCVAGMLAALDHWRHSHPCAMASATLYPVEYPMNRTQDGERTLHFEDLELGVAVGLWVVATGGYEWRSDLDPVSLSHGIGLTDEGRPDPGPWLVPVGNAGRRYPVLRRRGLLAEFAALAADPAAARIKAFASRFGLLGHGQFLLPKGAKSGRLDDHGESLGTWITALLTFREVWTLWMAVTTLRDPDVHGPTTVNAAQRLLDARIPIGPDGSARYHGREETLDGAYVETHQWLASPELQTVGSKVLLRLAKSGDMCGLAGFEAARRVNEKLGGVSPKVHAFQAYAVRYAPEDLETAIWYEFALFMAGAGGRQVPCAYCGQLFPKSRSNRRFCSAACQSSAAYHRRSGNLQGPALEGILPARR